MLRFVLEGLSNKEIAWRLQISESYVKAILQSLFQKTGVRTRGQLVRVALSSTKTNCKRLVVLRFRRKSCIVRKIDFYGTHVRGTLDTYSMPDLRPGNRGIGVSVAVGTTVPTGKIWHEQ